MFDTPHPAHKPPAPDRLAPSEARGVVTDAIIDMAEDVLDRFHWMVSPNAKGEHTVKHLSVQAVVRLCEALRARESAPAVERDGEVVITTNEAGTVCYAVTRQDEEGRILSVIWKAPAPSVATGCAGEVKE